LYTYEFKDKTKKKERKVILQKRYCILKISLLCIIFPSLLNENLISCLIKASRLILHPLMWKFSLKNLISSFHVSFACLKCWCGL